MNRKFLITGGTGNLGRRLASELVTSGAGVVLFDNVEANIAGAEIVVGDITSQNDVDAAMRIHAPDCVFHLASLLSGSSEVDRELAWRVNVDGARVALESALAHGVSRIVFPSSLAAFGRCQSKPVRHETAQWPTTFYGVTKVAAERLGLYYHEQHGLDFRCVRLPVVVSPDAPAGAASNYASRAFVDAAETGRFAFRVRPDTRPSLVYVRDAVQAMVQLATAHRSSLSRQIYNIQALSPKAKDLAEVVRKRFPHAAISFEPDPEIADMIESWPIEFDDASARNDWSWRPEFDLDSMADDIVQQLQPTFANLQTG